MLDTLITVEYWPNTGTWRILVAGVPVGYWPTQDEAETRARQARRALAAHASDQDANISVRVAHRITEAPEEASWICAVAGCESVRTGQSPYCKKHHMRWRRHGDPTIALRPWGKKVTI